MCLKQGPGVGPDCVRQTDSGQDFLLLGGAGKVPVTGGIDVSLAHREPSRGACPSQPLR